MNSVKLLSIMLVVVLILTVWNMYSVETLRRDFAAEAREIKSAVKTVREETTIETYVVNTPLLSDKVTIHPSLVKWLKKSHVIFVDDMEGALKWTTYGNGTIGIDDEIVFNGEKSLSIVSPEGSWQIMEALRLFSPPKHKVMGFAFWWTCYGTNFGYIDFGIEFRNALNNYRKAGEIYIYSLGLPYYRVENGDIIRFSKDSGLPSSFDTAEVKGDLPWHFTAIIIDFEKSEYVSFLIDDSEVMMNGIKLYDRMPREGPSEYNMMEVFFIVSNGDKGQPAQCFFDDIIVFNLSESQL